MDKVLVGRELKPCPFCGGECDATGWLRGDGVRGPECEGCGATAASVEAWSRRAQTAEAEGSLADRMRAAGMMTIEEMMAGAPLDRFMKHAGVNDLETYGQWLDMKCREFLTMQARRELNKDPEDDMYEWVLAHAAVFQEARINFKDARDAHLAALSAVTAERDKSISLNADYIAMLGEAGLEIDKLCAELETVKKIAYGNLELLDENAKLRAEVEMLRKDAELYRRLRDLPDDQVGTAGVPCVAVPRGPFSGTYVSGAELDAAMAAKEA